MSIHCTVVLGDLPINISWLKDGKPIQPGFGLTIRDFESESTLLIRSASLEHNGNYTCIAKNPAATVSRTAVVIVDGNIAILFSEMSSFTYCLNLIVSTFMFSNNIYILEDLDNIEQESTKNIKRLENISIGDCSLI